MSEIRVIEIHSPEDFRKVALEFAPKLREQGIVVGDKGRLPMRAVARLLIAAQLSSGGAVQCVDTPYFPISQWALGKVVASHKNRDGFSYVITYSVKDVEGEQTMTLTDAQVNNYLPNVKGKMGTAYATMLVALHLNGADGLLSALTTYTVDKVERVLTASVPVAVTTDETPEGKDTGEDKPEADKASEAEHAPESVNNAAIVAGDESVKAEQTPKLVPAHAPKPAAKSRKTPARKAAAK